MTDQYWFLFSSFFRFFSVFLSFSLLFFLSILLFLLLMECSVPSRRDYFVTLWIHFLFLAFLLFQCFLLFFLLLPFSSFFFFLSYRFTFDENLLDKKDLTGIVTSLNIHGKITTVHLILESITKF